MTKLVEEAKVICDLTLAYIRSSGKAGATVDEIRGHLGRRLIVKEVGGYRHVDLMMDRALKEFIQVGIAKRDRAWNHNLVYYPVTVQ